MSLTLNAQTPCFGEEKDKLRLPEDYKKGIFWWDKEIPAPVCSDVEYKYYTKKDFRFDMSGSTTLYDL